jgi:hypothetical protein
MVVIARFRAAPDAIDSRGMDAAWGKHTCQHCSAGAQDTGPGSGLDRFQIRSAFSLSGKNYLEERLDFACDFLMNGKSRFFSSSVQLASWCSEGRSRQICSLTAVSSALSA